MKKTFLMLAIIAMLFLVACSEDIKYGAEVETNNINENSLSEIEAEEFYDTEYDLELEGDVFDRNTLDERDIITHHIQASYSFSHDLEEMTSRARYIVRVKILDEQWSQWISLGSLDDPFRQVITITQVQILESFKGSLQVGATIPIAQSGGQIGNERWVWNDITHFVPGDNLILFLNREGMDAYGERMPRTPYQPWQAIYYAPNFQEAEIMSMASSERNAVLESVSTENHLTLTIGDLQRIAEENNRR